MKEQTCWQASDGEVFFNKDNCQEHEDLLTTDAEVEKYSFALEQAGLQARAINMRANIVSEYLRWKINGVLKYAHKPAPSAEGASDE